MGVEAVVGERGAPKADMNDNTMQGISRANSTRHVWVVPLERPILKDLTLSSPVEVPLERRSDGMGRIDKQSKLSLVAGHADV